MDVLITGAAGGIGRPTLEAFAAAGERVLSLDRSPLPASMSSLEPAPLSMVCDLTDDASVEAATRQIADVAVDLRHFIGIAGGAFEGESRLGVAGQFPDAALFRRSLELNLVSQWNVLHRILPLLQAAAAKGVDCSITFVSSINALASYGLVGYSAAKAGLHGLTVALCAPLGDVGIRVNSVACGTVRTPRSQGEWAHVADHFERLDRTTTLGRSAVPAQIAVTLRALALDLTHVTGQVLVVDGGQMMKRSY